VVVIANQAIQTTNLGVGRSNRSGRASYLFHKSPILKNDPNSPRLKILFSLGFSLGNFLESSIRSRAFSVRVVSGTRAPSAWSAVVAFVVAQAPERGVRLHDTV
jgi:hypothetical protein